MKTQAQATAEVRAAFVMACVAVVVCLSISCGSPSADNGSRVKSSTARVHRIGEVGKLDDGKNDVVTLSLTEKAYNDLLNTVYAKDDAGFSQMLTSGSIFEVQRGTAVRVIGYPPTFIPTMLRVRILAGEHLNEAGWLPFEFVK